ncbi:hypothetical protein GOP47_0000077 [Adiantum capillus-veneris]|uniref:DUF7036 domain-containing protein n=1 Tax=Adiantum capillus-veneris TaxID=13818 RepID=A0A9D4VCV7_ADICA|nr:hypothetical protein GOP47_0000077 [Adiantum capillus-veneris]
MGKEEAESASVLEDATASGPLSCCCTKAACKWPVPVILGIYVLVFAIWSVRFHRGNGKDSQPTSSAPWIPHVEASFRLRRSVLEIHESLPQLQVDLQNEIGIPDTQIDIVSLAPLSYKNWTEVRFTVSPDRSSDSIASPELSLLKDTFVELFMQRSANLSLTSNVFGRVSHFEVLQFPGGITVVPPQPGFPLSKVLVLFNFTLHNSLSHVHRNFAKFRQQLATGIVLKPNESLFVQLTNVEGSTVNPPVVVQTSILPVVGVMLPSPRLKQLAWEIIASPKRNLGLNHTLFGRVKKIELSSYLEYSLGLAQTPSPSPSPAPSVSPCSSPGSADNRRHRGFRRHRQHTPSTAPRASPYHRRGRRPISSRIAPAPLHHQWRHPVGALPPMYPPSHPSWQLPPSTSPSISNQPPSAFSPSPAMVASKSHPIGNPPSADVWTVAHAPTSSGVQSEAPVGSTPSLSPSPSQFHERIALTPVASPPTSSAIIVRVSLWAVLMCVAVHQHLVTCS